MSLWKKEPWRKLPVESTEDYGLFCMYLHSGEGPMRDFASFVDARPGIWDTTQRYKWLERAEKYDEHKMFLRLHGILPFTHKSALISKQLVETDLTRKREEQLRCDRPILESKDLRALLNMLTTLDRTVIQHDLWKAQGAREIDVDSLSLDELEMFREMLLKVGAAG